MKGRKLLACFGALALLCGLLGSCSATGGGEGKRIIRISHGQQATHPDHLAMEAFKKHVESKLGDKYEVKIFANGLLGDSKNALELCQTGALEYVIASASNMETFSPMYQLFSMPYLFGSSEAYLKAMEDPKLFQPLYDSTKDSGIETVTWFDAGSRNFYSTKPIKTPADLKGMKIRVQPSPTNIAMMAAFGASATPMGFSEVYTALQQHVIDGAENNELALTDQKHGEVAPYYSYDMHQSVPDFLVVNLKFLNGLSPEERKVFDEATKIANNTELVEWQKAVAEAKKKATEMGVKFIYPDVEAFRKMVLPLHEKMLAAVPSLKPIYDSIGKYNAEYPAKQETGNAK